jgi:hypothetical protein
LVSQVKLICAESGSLVVCQPDSERHEGTVACQVRERTDLRFRRGVAEREGFEPSIQLETV